MPSNKFFSKNAQENDFEPPYSGARSLSYSRVKATCEGFENWHEKRTREIPQAKLKDFFGSSIVAADYEKSSWR